MVVVLCNVLCCNVQLLSRKLFLYNHAYIRKSESVAHPKICVSWCRPQQPQPIPSMLEAF